VQGEDEGGDKDEGSKKAEAEAALWLRMYERSKLRWHFAVATFDNAETASRVYAACDGHEFEESSVCFDLRFVPDIEDFGSRQVCTLRRRSKLHSMCPTWWLCCTMTLDAAGG
jgi:hypothetical protein